MCLWEELNREREESNYFQQRRDKNNTFQEIAERQLDEVKAEQKSVEKDMEEDESRHQVDIKVRVNTHTKVLSQNKSAGNKAVPF